MNALKIFPYFVFDKFVKMYGDVSERPYPDPNAIIYPQQLPYRGSIPGGVHEGKLIEIRGSVPYGADVFQVNLLTGLDPSSDRPLHISVRFQGRVVVRNSMEHNSWGPEERHGVFPFSTGQEFKMLILVGPSAYRIAVNNQHCWEFPHRITYTRVSSLYICGSVQIERIEYIDKVNPAYPPGICMPGRPFYPGGDPTRGQHIPGMPSTTCVPLPAQIPGVYPPRGIGSHIIPPPEQQIGVCPIPAQPVSNLSPVYNPPIPYAYPIYGGLRPGMMCYISGRPSASAYRMSINFQSGSSPYPPPDIAFHFDVRFYNFTIVRNSRTNNVWGNEETHVSHFPFTQGVNFDMIFRMESDKFMVAVNGQHFLEFRHRLMPLSRFDTLYVENDIIVSSIRFA